MGILFIPNLRFLLIELPSEASDECFSFLQLSAPGTTDVSAQGEKAA